ncbi:hypothetical protein [Streptomyces sp. NPDC054940]
MTELQVRGRGGELLDPELGTPLRERPVRPVAARAEARPVAGGPRNAGA